MKPSSSNKYLEKIALKSLKDSVHELEPGVFYFSDFHGIATSGRKYKKEEVEAILKKHKDKIKKLRQPDGR